MTYLIIEHFRNRDPVPVYRRFQQHGRLAPSGVTYVGSWVTDDLSRCYQVMACDERSQLDEWLRNWEDLVEFEVYPVLSSAEVVTRLGARLAG